MTEPASGLTFDEFFVHEFPRLVAILGASTGSRHVAEGLAQDALFHARERWNVVAELDEPGVWVRGVALNRPVDEGRGRRRERTAPERIHRLREMSQWERPSIDGSLWAGVRALPAEQRDAIVLRYVDDLPVTDIGLILDCDEAAVEDQLQQGSSAIARSEFDDRPGERRTDDQDVEELLVAAGERRRAAAPDAAETRSALQQVDSHRDVGDEPDDAVRHRRRLIALAGAGAAALVIGAVAIGMSVTDTDSDAPAVGADVSSPRSDTAATPDSPEVPDLAFGEPAARAFEGLPLTDIAVSPDAELVAAVRDDELCIISTTPSTPSDEDRCVAVPAGIDSNSMSWSPDATTVVFHEDRFGNEEAGLVELNLADGESTVLIGDGETSSGDSMEDQVFAPTFAADGTLYVFRVEPGDSLRSVLHRYDGDGDGEVAATGPEFDGVAQAAGRSGGGETIVNPVVDGQDTTLVSVDVSDGTSRSVLVEGGQPLVADVAGNRVLLVGSDGVLASGFQMGVADFTTGNVDLIDVPQIDGTSMRLAGGGLSPDGTQVALIVAAQNDAEGHLLLVADIDADGSVGLPAVMATGTEFVPNAGDRTIKPAGLGNAGEIVWTDTALIYTLGPSEIVTLPLL